MLTKDFSLRLDGSRSFLAHLENRERGEVALSLEEENDGFGGLHRLLLEDHGAGVLHLDKCGNLRIEPRIELGCVFIVRRGVTDEEQGGNSQITLAKWSPHQIYFSPLNTRI